MKSRISPQRSRLTRLNCYAHLPRFVVTIFAIVVLMFTSCTRRPVQKDVVLQGDPTRRSSADGDELQSSHNAANAQFERRFFDTVIELHLRAIDAEQMVNTRSQHTELKRFAKTLIARQQNDIETLRALRTSWFDDDPKTIDLDLAGAKDALHAIDLERIDPLKEKSFDLEFIGQLKSFLESIAEMAHEAKSLSSHDEVKQFADKITNANSSDVEQLKKWEAEWKRP
jgi:uncharacterized protein (DUF305 family)